MQHPAFKSLVPATAAIALVAACSSEIPPTPAVRPAPIKFEMQTGRVALAPVTIDLKPGRGIGSYSRNVDCWVHVRDVMPTDFPQGALLTSEVVKALGEAQLKVTPVAGSDVAAAGDVEYLLVASVPEARADLCIDNIWNEGPADVDAEVTLAWHLWSVRDNRIVYETTTSGIAHTKDPNETINAGVVAASGEAARQLLQLTAVQQYLTYGRVVQQAAPAASPTAAPVPAGGTAPIPTPPPGFQRAMPELLPPVLVPVRSAYPPGTPLDPAAARAATVAVGRTGAAVALGEGYLLTSTATLGTGLSTEIMLGGVATDARVIRSDAEAGVALLKVDAKLPPALPLQPKRNAVGDKVFGVGPGGVVQGTFTATRAAGGRDAVKLPGALVGGPVTDASGNVIGLLGPDGSFVSVGIAFRALQLGAQPTDE